MKENLKSGFLLVPECSKNMACHSRCVFRGILWIENVAASKTDDFIHTTININLGVSTVVLIKCCSRVYSSFEFIHK